MAIWTVNTNADDGSVDTDTRTGSLRGIIGSAANGDTIFFDNAGEEPPFPDGVETSIALSSKITFDKVLTIDGGETWTENGVLKTRVVLDGQSSTSIMDQTYGQAGFVLRGLTFKNGAGATGLSSSSGLKFNGRETIIDHCVFDSCKSENGGAINAKYATEKSTISHCFFKNCEAKYNGGAYYSYRVPNMTINNCTFDTCKAAYGGALFFTNTYTRTKTLNNCIFMNCEATSSGASIYNATATSVVNVLNCTFGETTSNNNIANSGELIINDVLNVDKINIANDATVTFAGVDSILAITTTATIGTSTFTAAEGATGYAAFPAGTDISAATFDGVVACDYGANVTSFTTFALTDTSVGFTIEKTGTANVLLERKLGTNWRIVSTDATNETIDENVGGQLTYRVFDGVNFFVSSVMLPTTFWTIKCWAVAKTNGGSEDKPFVVSSWALDPEID